MSETFPPSSWQPSICFGRLPVGKHTDACTCTYDVAIAYCYGYGNTHAVANGYCVTFTKCHGHGIAHCYSYANAHTVADGHGYADAFIHPNAHATAQC